MNKKRRIERNKEVIDYRKTHTLYECSLHFDLCINQIHRIAKKWKLDNAIS